MPLCVLNINLVSWIVLSLLPVPSTTHLCLCWLQSALHREAQHMLCHQEHLPSKIWDGWVASHSMTSDRTQLMHRTKGWGEQRIPKSPEVWCAPGGFCCWARPGSSMWSLPQWKMQWGFVSTKLRWSSKLRVSPCASPPPWTGTHASSWGGNKEHGSQENGIMVLNARADVLQPLEGGHCVSWIWI